MPGRVLRVLPGRLRAFTLIMTSRQASAGETAAGTGEGTGMATGMGRYDDCVAPGLVDRSFATATSRRHVDLLRVSSALCPALILRATLRLSGPAR